MSGPKRRSQRPAAEGEAAPEVASRRLPIIGQTAEPVERADAARNRAAILRAARKLLQKRPITEICMDDLAEAAGVGKGTLYRRFEDRASLCRALLDDSARALQAEVLRGFGLDARATWLERLTRLLDAFFDFVADNAVLLSEALAFERNAGKRFENPAYVWQHDSVALHLSRAAHANEIEALDTGLTADFILAALDPDLIRAHLAHGRSIAELREDFRRFWQLGVFGPRSVSGASSPSRPA